jgi:hypothetical protein
MEYSLSFQEVFVPLGWRPKALHSVVDAHD